MSQWVHVFAVLALFTCLWAPTQRDIFWDPVFFSETKSKPASLEPLNGFLAYLDPKSWLKNLIFDKNESNKERYDLPSQLRAKFAQPYLDSRLS